MTTRGMGVDDARLVADWIVEAIEARDDETRLGTIRSRVHEMCGRHPMYREALIS